MNAFHTPYYWTVFLFLTRFHPLYFRLQVQDNNEAYCIDKVFAVTQNTRLAPEFLVGKKGENTEEINKEIIVIAKQKSFDISNNQKDEFLNKKGVYNEHGIQYSSRGNFKLLLDHFV